jgi:hypothetical protein
MTQRPWKIRLQKSEVRMPASRSNVGIGQVTDKSHGERPKEANPA